GRLLEDNARQQLRLVVLSHARSIETHLQEQVHLLQLLAESNSLSEISNTGTLATLFKTLNQTSNQGFVDLGVIDDAGNHLAYIGPYALQDRNYRNTEWFREVMTQGTFISDVFMGFRQVPHCIIAVKCQNHGSPWILRATINSDSFEELVRHGNRIDLGDVFIVNREGVFQTTPRHGKLLEPSGLTMVQPHDGVADHRMHRKEGDKILVTTWINKYQWMLVVEKEARAVQAPVNRAIAAGAPVVLLAILLAALTTFGATSHLTSLIDRANQKREEALRAFMRSAKLASIGELATGLAHEINNPLAIISAEQTNLTDLILEANLNATARQTLLDSTARTQRQVQRCAGITGRMLRFGRNKDAALEPTDLAVRLKDICALLERQAGVRNIAIKLDMAPNLPPVLVDPIELEQVAVNLINNAFDAMPQGGEIKITASIERDKVVLVVKDTGPGIPPEVVERVFEPFFTTKPAGKGTGLGLSVCYGIVHSWGGQIEARSKLGQGASIIIRLPIPQSDTPMHAISLKPINK
ncbi:MAG: ATP-binding protein, partial [Calditrichota bacterium]